MHCVFSYDNVTVFLIAQLLLCPLTLTYIPVIPVSLSVIPITNVPLTPVPCILPVGQTFRRLA